MPTTPARTLLLCLAVGLTLTACPDPTQTSAGPGAGASGPGGPGGAPPPAGGPGAGAAGAGGPGPDGVGKRPGGGRPDQARFNVTEGEGVQLSGTFSYSGAKSGSHRIDFLTMPAGTPPVLVHALTLDAPGEWSIEAPKDFGELYIVAFIDQAGDGPSPDDPAGRLAAPLEIASTPLTGLSIELTDDADLGDLAPNAAAPPDGSGPPPTPGKGPEGDTPPEGAEAPAAEPGDAPPAVPGE